MEERHQRMAAIAGVIAAISVMSCGSDATNESDARTDAEPLVVQQVSVMRDLRSWGAEHVKVAWFEGNARIQNDGDQVLFCGVTDSEQDYFPNRYFGIRPGQARDLAIPDSPFVRCHVTWDHASTIVGRDEEVLGKMFEEPFANGEPMETTHAASIVLMRDPMPPVGVQIDDRYTLLD